MIKDCLVKEEYKYSKNPGQIRRTTDINREPINLISFGINKDGTRFRISVEILD